jgi:hypothetical protein
MTRRARTWLREWVAVTSIAALSIAAMGCGRKEPAVPPPVAAPAPSVLGPDAAQPLAPELDAAAAEKLAATYHAIRCVLVGAALAPTDLYRQHGYEDGPAFSAAFAAQATRRPDWAHKAVADSLAKPCASEGAPAAPTPTAAP